MTDTSFGRFGGQYVPEVLMEALAELEDAYERYVLDNEDGFRDDFRERLREFGGRPTPLQRAEALSDRYDADVYLKREDLVHGGAHKLNNALGQVLLATYMGKERVVAETGAGQHGTATAMAAAHLDVPCEVYMGRTDVDRQRPNVHRMHLNGATVTPVTAGSGTLKEAINETLRDWATNVEDTHYVIGSVVGPHPFPRLVREFQSVIGEELREQVVDATGQLPDSVVACTGGGSNAMGAFDAFVGGGDADDASGVADDASGRSVDDVALYAVEAGGSGLTVDAESGVAPHSASLVAGDEGVLHGARTRLLQDGDGQVVESHSVSAGLDYAGVGPELAHLAETGRVTPVAVGDDAALEAFHRLSRLEGVIPALESAHALAFVERALGGGSEAGDAAEAGDTEGGDEPLDPADHDLGDLVVINLSGRGDKDLESVLEETDRRDLEEAPEMEVFE